MKRNKERTFLNVTMIVIFIMIGLWTIDIGVSGMVLTESTGVMISASNGWWVRSSAQQYHIGLYMVIIGMIGLLSYINHLYHAKDVNVRIK